jgi:hypothetical protein
MKKYLFIVVIFISVTAKAQTQKQKPCSAPEASQFDFWVGDWDLTWNDTSYGANKILKIMGGCTVNENFNSPSQNYTGSSWSVYNPQAKLWQQTWIDNQGGYIVLSGKFENGEMKLSTQPRKLSNGTEIISRMVYYNITPNTFDWRWEASADNEATWKINWLIHYKRKT